MARLYADEQFPHPVVEYLRSLGHMMSAKSTTIDVGAGLSNKLAWQTENSQSKPALRLGFIKVNQPDMIS